MSRESRAAHFTGQWTVADYRRHVPRIIAERDRAEAALHEIRTWRNCLGAGPMDYEAFVDAVDEALAASLGDGQ